MRQMSIKQMVIAVVGLAAVLVISQSVFVINEKEQAIVLQLGQHVATIHEPGLHFKIPLIQTVYRFEDRVMVADLPPTEFLTGDLKRLVVDSVTRWRIEDPLQFFKTVRTEPVALARLGGIISSELRRELATHNFVDAIGIERKAIMDAAAKRTREVAADLGVYIVDVRKKRADLPVEVQASIFARMMAERERMAMRYRAEGEEMGREIKAEADKKAIILLATAHRDALTLKGTGDAEAARIYADAFERDAAFFSFVRSLEAYGRFIPGGTTLVMDADADLFRYLWRTDTPGRR